MTSPCCYLDLYDAGGVAELKSDLRLARPLILPGFPRRWRQSPSFQGFGATDDFGDLFCNVCLSRAIVLPRQRLDHVVGVLGRLLHGPAPRDLLADRGVEEAL